MIHKHDTAVNMKQETQTDTNMIHRHDKHDTNMIQLLI